MKPRFLLLLALLLLALTPRAQAGTRVYIGIGGGYYGGYGYHRCWHPYLGGYPLYPVNPWVPYIPVGGCPVPPPPAPPAHAPVPYGFVDGRYLRSPWSPALIPLASVKSGQTVYDSNTGAPFLVP